MRHLPDLRVSSLTWRVSAGLFRRGRGRRRGRRGEEGVFIIPLMILSTTISTGDPLRLGANTSHAFRHYLHRNCAQ